jgi:hypothetical protein
MHNPLSNNFRKLVMLFICTGLTATALVGCGDETSFQGDQYSQMRDREMALDRESQQKPESTPVPAPTIDPFYGSGPGGAFYGH